MAALEAEKPVDSGEARLNELGYRQELRRDLSGFHNFAIMFAVASVMTGVTASYSIGFNNGGPVAIVWGWVIVAAFSLILAASLAEICSSLPTSGGNYFWAAHLGGRHATLACWLTGWLNLLGWVAATASVDFACASMIQSMILISTGGIEGGGYLLSNAQLLGVIAAIVVVQGVVNSCPSRVLAAVNSFAVAWNVLGVLVIIIMLPIVAKTHQSASYVFTHYEKNTGYGIGSNGYAFLIGMLYAQYTLSGYDTSAHVSEETSRADSGAAGAMLASLIISVIIGFGYILSITFCIQDTSFATLNAGAADGNVIGQIFYDVFMGRFGHPGGAVAAMMIPMVAQFFAGQACQTAQSRMTWAFARDGGLPFSSYLHEINPITGMPVPSIALSVVLAILLCLPLLKSTTAFNACVTIYLIGTFASYFIPIFLKLVVAGRSFQPGPINLGPYSTVCNVISLLWILLVCVIAILPTAFPVDSVDLNYTPVAFGIVLFGALIAWWLPGRLGARKWFNGPQPNLEAVPPKAFKVDNDIASPTENTLST